MGVSCCVASVLVEIGNCGGSYCGLFVMVGGGFV